jgi:hypothetical protein
MKNIKTLCFLVLSLATLVSCSYEPEIGSTITIYPIITVSGASPVFVPLGTPFIDPGATAKAGTVTVPVVTTAIGKFRGTTSLDTSKADEYLVNYRATNSDGFSANASRRVIVYKNGDLVNNIEGLYTCTISRNGVTPGASYRNIKYIHIWKNTNGSYEVSDAFGGWYEYGRAIADSRTSGGIINAINIPTNSFTFPATLSNDYFGGTAKITGLTINAATKTVVLTCVWNTAAPVTVFTFVATLTQVQP